MAAPFPQMTLNRPASEFPTLERYFNDAGFRARLDAERAAGQAEINLMIRGNQERFWERQRARREVNEAIEIMVEEVLS